MVSWNPVWKPLIEAKLCSVHGFFFPLTPWTGNDRLRLTYFRWQDHHYIFRKFWWLGKALEICPSPATVTGSLGVCCPGTCRRTETPIFPADRNVGGDWLPILLQVLLSSKGSYFARDHAPSSEAVIPWLVDMRVQKALDSRRGNFEGPSQLQSSLWMGWGLCRECVAVGDLPPSPTSFTQQSCSV